MTLQLSWEKWFAFSSLFCHFYHFANIEIHWLLSKIALMEQVESSCDIKWTDCGAYCTMYSLEKHTHVLECFVLAVARIIKINRTIPSWIEDALSDKVLYNAQDRSATQERSRMYKWLDCAILPSFVGVHEWYVFVWHWGCKEDQLYPDDGQSRCLDHPIWLGLGQRERDMELGSTSVDGPHEIILGTLSERIMQIIKMQIIKRCIP